MIVFGLVGIFLIKAAVDFNARAAVGLDGALAKIVHRPTDRSPSESSLPA